MLNLDTLTAASAAMYKATGISTFWRVESPWDDNSKLFFYADPLSPGEYYTYYAKTGRIVKCYIDTWRHPEHIEVIVEGR